MKIIYKKGDLLQAGEKILIHGVSMAGVMGAGVAKAIKNRYPKAYSEYKQHCNRHKKGPFAKGDYNIVDCGDKLIINAITQEHYGREKKRYVSYTAVRLIMNNLNTLFIYYDIGDKWGYAMAMPKIGAGLAGGDWGVIEKIIEEECKDVQPVVYYL